jgi:hypothetical protein
MDRIQLDRKSNKEAAVDESRPVGRRAFLTITMAICLCAPPSCHVADTRMTFRNNSEMEIGIYFWRERRGFPEWTWLDFNVWSPREMHPVPLTYRYWADLLRDDDRLVVEVYEYQTLKKDPKDWRKNANKLATKSYSLAELDALGWTLEFP